MTTTPSICQNTRVVFRPPRGLITDRVEPAPALRGRGRTAPHDLPLLPLPARQEARDAEKARGRGGCLLRFELRAVND